MSKQRFQATLSREKGRKEWCVIFRHPVAPGPDGRPGLRVRRSLKTNDMAEAQRLVDQLNIVLGDESLWTPASREAAARRGYHHLIVAAFYDALTASSRDSWAVRSQIIPLRGRNEGYKQVLLMGMTGSGKTTLFRQFIGNESFPATSPNRTTTCSIEGIIADGPYKAVITFFSKDEVRQYIEDNVLAASLSAYFDDAPPDEVARKLLGHRDQRFRLNYILGRWQSSSVASDPVDEEDETPMSTSAKAIANGQREKSNETILAYVERIQRMGETVLKKHPNDPESSTVGTNASSNLQDSNQENQENIEGLLTQDEDFHELVDDILEDVESRFKPLATRVDYEPANGWPMRALIERSDHQEQEFFEILNRFSGNHASSFGELLTPLVDGIRFSGPFSPKWWQESYTPRLVFVDGEGLGHQATTASSVPTEITKRFRDTDIILLVDTATTPMQASSLVALRTVIASGYDSKLVICFTHCDALKSETLPDTESQHNHVIASLDQVISTIGKELGPEAEHALNDVKPNRVFFVSKIQNELPRGARGTREQFRKMVKAFEANPKPLPPGAVKLSYNDSDLIFSKVRKALEAFHGHWRARLGLEYRLDVHNEHWTRVRALSRQIALFHKDQYDNLQPVANLIQWLSEEFSRFLDNPARCEPATVSDDQRRAAIASIKNEVSTALQTLVSANLINNRLKDWLQAFALSGKGSARPRSMAIRDIYTSSAPIPGVDQNAETDHFILELKTLVRRAVRSAGGQMVAD